MGVALEAAAAFKEAKEIGLKSLIQHDLVRHGLVKSDDRFGSGAKFWRQSGADLLDARLSQLV